LIDVAGKIIGLNAAGRIQPTTAILLAGFCAYRT